MRWLALIVVLAGCAELGVVSDGTSISVGKPSRGYLIEGTRLPDLGEGFVTREVWRARDNRFGTDETIDLVTGVARRMHRQAPDVRLVVADLSGAGGGQRAAFHRSHQSGRDVDLLYYMRDPVGQPFEPDAMHAFNAWARAVDDAAQHEAEDKLRKEAIEARNQLDSLVYQTRKLVQDNGGKLGEPEKLMIEEELKSAEGVLERNREADKPDELRAAFEKLQAAAHKLAEVMYKQTGGEGAAGGEPGPAPGGGAKDDVIDAEFEDKS